MKIILYILKNQAQGTQKTNSFIQGKSDTITKIQVKPILTVVIRRPNAQIQCHSKFIKRELLRFIVYEVMILEVSLEFCNIYE